ncbi:MAG: transglycosylase domain-containing protein [Anditalea sp.]
MKIALKWAGKILLCCFICSIGVTLLYRMVPVFFTPLMAIRLFEQSFDEEREIKLIKDWVSIDHISQHMAQAVVAAEDQKFPDHFGFDRGAIEKALVGNKPAKELSRSESAMIAAILPNPLRWSPTRPTAYIYERQSWILRNMNNLDPVGFGQ